MHVMKSVASRADAEKLASNIVDDAETEKTGDRQQEEMKEKAGAEDVHQKDEK